MWWLQRAASTLNTAVCLFWSFCEDNATHCCIQDPLISPYVARVVPSVQQMLNTTKQRLSIIPGPPIETTRTISEIQDILSRKPL